MLLSVQGIHKSFPGVRALEDVSLGVAAGEVHALLGENGAGKSTLLKILAGAQGADRGAMTFNGARLDARDPPRRRQSLGIVTIYQEFNLAANLSVAENMFLGREPTRGGFVDWRRLRADAAAALARLGAAMDPAAKVRDLSVGEQQIVEIARALTLEARLIVMDEPTAALSEREAARLHAVIAGLKASGVAIIYVTHRLGEVKSICDRFSVLRDGRKVSEGAVADVGIADLVRAMVGRDLAAAAPRARTRGPPALRFEPHAGAGFTLHAGEIVGLAGLVGAGRTELARRLFGASRGDGSVWVGERSFGAFRSPAHAMRAGLAMAPEDRKAQGCFLSHPVLWNLSLPSLPRLSRLGFVDRKAELALAARYIARLRIRTPSPHTAIGALSGGNQQKALLARSMALSPKVLIVDEPTRGVDVSAKAEVHAILFDLAESGVAVLAISSDLPELLAISDRILVMHEGALVGEADGAKATEEELMFMMTGQRQSPAAAK